MKIIPKRLSEKNRSKNKGINRKPPDQEVSFLEKLQTYESNIETLVSETEEISFSDFENLAGIIEQLGEDLTNHPTSDNFLKYKNHIKIFMRLLKENSEVVTTHRGYRKSPILTLEILDKDLDQLATSILNQEKNRLKYLKLTEDIKGLILDLIL